MSEFFVGSQEDAGRCHRSLDDRAGITIIGTTGKGEIMAFTGIVHSVEEDPARPMSRRWRITMQGRARE